jgi:DNA-damage-inducible protein D
MATKRSILGGIQGLLADGRVRRIEREGRTLYAVVDVIAALADSRRPAEYWADLKLREPALAGLVEAVEFTGVQNEPTLVGDGSEVLEAATFDGVLRLVQSIPSAKAERIKRWLAATAKERLEEQENPELAVLRTRRLYEQRGYSRQWVDKRLRGVSARHELTGEWYKRGAAESDQYRALTNAIMEGAFGMDVEAYRNHKHLYKTGQNLRDHMTDLELALTALGETVAVALHRDRKTQGFEDLQRDAQDAGSIVAKTREEIEGKTGHAVVEAGNARAWWMGGRRSGGRVRTVSGVTEVTAQPGQDAPVQAETSPEAPPAVEAPDKAVA